jgi:hypothetical protein
MPVTVVTLVVPRSSFPHSFLRSFLFGLLLTAPLLSSPFEFAGLKPRFDAEIRRQGICRWKYGRSAIQQLIFRDSATQMLV